MDFHDYIRDYLNLDESSTYWDDPEAALDHHDAASLSELALWFYNRGLNAGDQRR